MFKKIGFICSLLFAGTLVFLSGTRASAIDLSVENMEVTQSIQYLDNPANTDNSLTLVRGRRTTVRMYIDVSGPAPVAGVDGQLEVLVNGVAMTGSPFGSKNGPITAPLAPLDREETQHTLNFEFEIPGIGFGPTTSDVELIGTVDPAGLIAESDEGNNSMTLEHVSFECRKAPALPICPLTIPSPNQTQRTWVCLPFSGCFRGSGMILSGTPIPSRIRRTIMPHPCLR